MKTFVESNLGTRHHWHALSQTYASGHILFEHLQLGWQPEELVETARFYFGDQRHVDVYYFVLTRDEKRVEMPVLYSPAVRNFIRHTMRISFGVKVPIASSNDIDSAPSEYRHYYNDRRR